MATMTDTIPTHTTTTTTMTAVATLSVAACIPATAGGFDRSRSADNMLPKKLAGAAGGFLLAQLSFRRSTATIVCLGRTKRGDRYCEVVQRDQGIWIYLTRQRRQGL